MKVSTNLTLNGKAFKNQKMKFKFSKEVFGKKNPRIVGQGNILHKAEEILGQGLGEDDVVKKNVLIINCNH